jgi:tRNA threonylcarbamoyladenosine biosynthesis protein TsaB
MLILAVDTSGREGGIALARGVGDQIDIIDSASIEGGTFSAELIPQIASMLAKNELALQQIEGTVAVTGPGSFTGLRVGLTAVKGLAEVSKFPVATVTSLEVLLAAAGGHNTLAVLDAGRGEVYACMQAGGMSEEILLSVADATELARAHDLRVVAADANIASKFENSQLVRYRSSEVAARVGIKKLFTGDIVDLLALDANYIRKSEAEYMQKLKR